MTKNYDQLVGMNHNLNWPYTPDHPHRILLVVQDQAKLMCY